MNSIKISVLIFIIAHLFNNPKEKKFNSKLFFGFFWGGGGLMANHDQAADIY